MILFTLILHVICKVKQESLADVKVKETDEELQQEKEDDHSCLPEEQLSGQGSVTSGNEIEITEELESEGRNKWLYISLINLSLTFSFFPLISY